MFMNISFGIQFGIRSTFWIGYSFMSEETRAIISSWYAVAISWFTHVVADKYIPENCHIVSDDWCFMATFMHMVD